MDKNLNKNRNILIAVDGSENSKRAVLYVGDIINSTKGFHVTIVNIISIPPDDYFVSEDEKASWIGNKSFESNKILQEHLSLLLRSGINKDDVDIKLVVKECISVAECILETQKKLNCGTIVIGRRGISKKEEFIYGSTSNKLLHSAKDCSVWIIE
ncbi:MAG: universal stress protein [Nitrospirae bacterium]|jgi:nucleotide-binding universal stress UspA family protein|nr:universal stress protein [Nitrospirota bacterium]